MDDKEGEQDSGGSSEPAPTPPQEPPPAEPDKFTSGWNPPKDPGRILPDRIIKEGGQEPPKE